MSVSTPRRWLSASHRRRLLIAWLPFSFLPLQPAAASEDWTITLDRLERRVAEVTDLTASFREYKYTALLKEPLVTIGRVRMLGERSRWDMESPTPMVMTVDAHEVKLYYPDRNAMEVFPVDARLKPLLVSPVAGLSRMRAQFDVRPWADDERHADAPAPQFLRLILTPTDASMKAYVDLIRITVDVESAYVRELELNHPDGDRTVLRFSDVRVNTGLSEADVSLTVPPGTEQKNASDVVNPADRSPE